MTNISYSNVYREVLVIINNLVKDDYEKIPKEYINFLECNCNNDYEFKYDTSKTFYEQELLDETKYILFGLFEKFGATEKQKMKINLFKVNYNHKLEEQKKKRYNSEDIFKKEQNNFNIQIAKEQEERLALIKYKEKKWYQQLFSKILKILRKSCK